MSEAENKSGSNACHLLSNANAIDEGNKTLASKQAIKKIFRIIEQKDNVVIKGGVKLLSTGRPCDGVFWKEESPCYIVVAPRSKLDLLEWQIKRINKVTGLDNRPLYVGASLGKQAVSKMSIMVCIYDFDNSNQIKEVDEARLKGLVRCHMVVRCFTKAELS